MNGEMKNFPKLLARLHVAFVLSYSLLIGTTDAFMGHGTSKSSRRESNAKSITSYSTSPPGENRDDIPETFSSLKNNTSAKSHRMSYLEGKAEYAVEKNLNLLTFEKEAELHVERDMELEAEMNVHQRSVVDQSHYVSTSIDDANESEKSSEVSIKNVPGYDSLNSWFANTPSSTTSTDRETPISSFQTYRDGDNQKKRALTPEELHSLELAAEEKAEKHVIQNVERASEIAMEKKVEELIDRDSQGGSTTTNESWNPVLGSKTVTKSTWFVSSYTLSKESNQELVPNEASFPSLETFPGTSVGDSQSIQQQNTNPIDLNATFKIDLEPDESVAARLGDDIHRVEKGYTSESSSYDTGTEKDESKNMKYTSVEEIQTTTESSLFGLAQGENLETTRKLTSPTLMSEMSINDLESMVEKMAEKGIEINAMEKAVEVNAEMMVETGLQRNANKDTLSPVVKTGDAPVVDETTTIGALEREMFQRSLLQSRFKIDQLERDQRASEKVLMGRDKLINTMPTVEYSLSKNGNNDMKDNEDEVDADAKEEMRNDASELEIFQRSLMETRFKIDKVQREVRAKKKAFVTHRKLLEARLHDEFLDKLMQQHILQTDGVNENETAKEAIAEKFRRTLLATRFSMDKCAKEKRRLVIAEAKQQELMKARFAHEAKVKLKREEIKAAAAERVQRALLATRLSMEIRVKEKTKLFITEAKQRDLLKARFAYEAKARERREKAIKLEDKLAQESSSVETEIDESIQKKTHDTSLDVMKSEPRYISGSKIKLDDSKPIHESSSNDLTSEVGAMAHEMLEKAKSVVSKVTNEARNAIGHRKIDSKEKKRTAKKGKKSSVIKKNAADSSMKQRFSLLSKLGFVDDAEENSMPQTAKEIKSNKFGRKHNKHQVSDTEKGYAKKKAAIMSARKQPKSKREEKKLAKKYGRLEPKERAYQILLDLGMIIEHPDPDSPSYDHTLDGEFVPFGEWV